MTQNTGHSLATHWTLDTHSGDTHSISLPPNSQGDQPTLQKGHYGQPQLDFRAGLLGNGAQPHIHGDLLQVLDPEQMPREGTFRERVAAMSKVPLVEKLYCYAHGQHCHALDPSDVEFSGLPCEENSRCNTKRRYMEGRFGDLYGAWARRHGYLKNTAHHFRKNTEDPCWNTDFSLYFVVYTTPWLP